MKNDTGKFLAGYSRKDVTPEGPVALGGMGTSWLRYSNRVLDPLYVQCAALTDAAGETLLLCTFDNVKVRDEIYLAAQAYFEEKYGLDKAHFHINASHSESTPDTNADPQKSPEIPAYNDLVVRQLIAAGEEALQDRVPASMEIGTACTWNLNFVKHAFLDTGVAIGDNHGRRTDGRILQHTTRADNAMPAVKFLREGRPDLVFVNWRAHNQFTSGFKKYDVSADYVGAFRDSAKEKFGCDLMFFQGCVGNVNPYSYIREEERTRDYKEFGKFLTEHLYEIYDHMTPIEAGKIRAKQIMVTARTNREFDDKLEGARIVADMYLRGEDREVCRNEALKYGLASVFQAEDMLRNAKMPDTFVYPVSLFTIGDVAFAANQFEIFDTLGEFVRDNSPYRLTFVLGLTDYRSSYMPSAYAYEYGCYEADTTKLAIGSGERCAAIMVENLIHMKYHFGE
ncbi:MAG: hypothetical protein J5794_00445 [Lachnospiraceae bacterium]|nr:hypothetical protein [Lachnospiraceae bacterium]